jgi:hypothetical protein
MSDTEPKTDADVIDTNQIIEERRAKLTLLRGTGNAFPNGKLPKPTTSIKLFFADR